MCVHDCAWMPRSSRGVHKVGQSVWIAVLKFRSRVRFKRINLCGADNVMVRIGQGTNVIMNDERWIYVCYDFGDFWLCQHA